MIRIIPVVIVCLALLVVPGLSSAGSSEVAESSSWSAAVHKENDLVASVLYLPYMIGRFPVGLISGIFNPKPTSQSTIPPPAHRQPH